MTFRSTLTRPVATEKTIEIRGSAKAAFRRIEREIDFLGRTFRLQFVRVDPAIEHAVRVEQGDEDFAGTLLIDQDDS